MGQTEARAGGSAFLVTLVGLRIGEMFKLTKALPVLGRSDEVALRLIDEGASRRHAQRLGITRQTLPKTIGSSDEA